MYTSMNGSRMVQPQAFLLLELQTRPESLDGPRILGVSVYSEENPTSCTGGLRRLVVLAGGEHSYAEGLDEIRRTIQAGPYYAWTIPLMSDHCRQALKL